MPPGRLSHLFIILLLSCITSACGRGEATPEEAIRALVREAELAAEERNVSDLARLISENYSDGHGHDKQNLVRMLRLQMIRNQVVYLLVRISSVSVLDENSATALVHLGMAGGPMTGLEDLARLGAELYRVELALARETGKWRITGADWRRALEEEFR